MKLLHGSLVCVLFLSAVACRRSPPPAPAPPPFRIYRFDDEFKTAATVSASHVSSSARSGQPTVWKSPEQKLTWKLARGRMGSKKTGELIVKGEGSTPVIVSPNDPPIDWSNYEAVLIRMVSEAGSEIKIKFGGAEIKQKLAPPMQYQVYRFELNIADPTFSRPLAIMPTDDLFAPVAIDFIELVPRKTSFPDPAGRLVIGKREEYRNALYAHAPSSITYEVPIPKGARLHFGMGIADKKNPVTFRVLAGGSNTELYSKTIDNADSWEDAAVDLSAYTETTKLVFQTASQSDGAVGLWANPLLTTSAPRNKPNVLIYLIDTLRPDHTSLYGYARETTPFLKKLGADGTVFEDCQAQATWTKPSVASMMTSLYSYTHGLLKDTHTIAKGATTLAEQLRAAGYVTSSIVANPFAGRTSGLDRGFDYMMEYPVVHRFRSDAEDRGTDSAAVNKVVLPWLEQHRDEPFFLYAHTTDPHAPYRPPGKYETLWAKASDTAPFNREYTRMREMRGYGGGATISPAECRAKGIDPDWFHRNSIDRYDGEIAFNDHNLDLLVGKLKDLGILEDTLIIVVSDHGEEFWEHGWSAHGHSLYQELAHCVFLMRNPKLLPTPRRITEPVQLIDILPTVLDLMGVKPEGIIEGQSLLPLLKGQPFQRKRAVMSSRFAHPNAKPGGLPENLTGTFAWFDSNWKLIYRDQAERAGINRVELYDRRTDRADKKNVASQQPQEAERLTSEVNQWIEAQKQIRKMLGPGGETTLDRQTIERLRSLGYLGGKATH
jgi:arylsulfatase A-like enzyme